MPRMIEWRPNLFSVNDGAFSSTKRYIRKHGSSGYAIVSGVAVLGVISGHTTPSTTDNFVTINMQISGYVAFLLNVPNISMSTPTPFVQNVTI